MEVMLLRPVARDYLWGGTRLIEEYNKKTDRMPLAETWECSVHPDGPSLVVSGVYKGKTLDNVLQEHPEYLGTKVAGGILPVLVKFIDAERELSVQVHPGDEYAAIYENQKGKTEMWYVLEARAGASLILGFNHDVTKEQLRQALETGEILKYLHRVPVHKGDVFYIPAGTVHAIGAGILVAEIQENSNLTYRIYDYDRKDKNGNKRELHIEKALEVLNMREQTLGRQIPRMVHYYPGCFREVLCRCKYFETERIYINKEFLFWVREESFQIILCLDGEGKVITDGQEGAVPFQKGDCLFIPAGLGRCQIRGNTEVLKVRC